MCRRCDFKGRDDEFMGAAISPVFKFGVDDPPIEKISYQQKKRFKPP